MNSVIPTPHLPPAPLNALSIFTGAGGFALGLENAGFQHLILAELDNRACATLRANRPHWDVREGDVANIDYSPYRGHVDVLEGGFPCQPFSDAGSRRGLEDTRGTLFYEFARAVRDTMPKVFIAENVRGLTTHRAGATLATMLDALSSITDPAAGTRYTIAHFLLSAVDFDVPQKRERLFIVGVRSDVASAPPRPAPSLAAWNLRDALDGVPQGAGEAYGPAQRDVYAQVPAGGCWRHLPVETQKAYLGKAWHSPGGKTSIARRLAWDAPSPTLTCSPTQKLTGFCHPDETRPLTVREYARVQTFPDDWVFSGSIAHQYKQIGNAVPVNLAFHLAAAARRTIELSARQRPGRA